MTFVPPSPERSTGWRERRYRTSLTAKEEDFLWDEVIEKFVDSDVTSPRAQMRLFKAIEVFTKKVHIERNRWKEMKELRVAPILQQILQEIFKRWDITFKELMVPYKNKHLRKEVMQARKYMIDTLHERKLSYYRIAKILNSHRSTICKWNRYDVEY